MKPIKLELKPVGKSDLATLLTLIQCFHEFDNLPYDKTAIRKVLSKLIQDPSLGKLWMIVKGPQILGYALITFGYSIEYLGKNAFLDEIFIKDEFRGKGYGEKALKMIQAAAKKLKVKTLHLEATRSNSRAIHLYQKVGFKNPDRVLMTYWVD